ncbi:hypothetical protein P7C70_g193, partial [Phenoliferia sp. Uapishka_3]
MALPRLGGTAPRLLWDALVRSTTSTAKEGAEKLFGASRANLERHLHQHLPTNPIPGPSLARALSDSVGAGVFKSIRSAPHTPHTPFASRIQPRASSLHAVRANFAGRRPPRAGFGPSPRPVAHPSNVSHLGLGVARNFSSSRPVLDNIIQNVPLGLRALVDADGIDSRKWKKVKQGIRVKESTVVKGKGRAFPRAKEMKRIEFNSFFGSTTVEAATSVVDEQAPVAAATNATIALVFLLVPFLEFDPSTSETSPDFLSHRILTPAVLHNLQYVQRAHETHAHRIHSLSNRLTQAGVFDDANITVELLFVNGEKMVEIRFPTAWTRADVEQACGDWRGTEPRWYDIVGGETGSTSDSDGDGGLEEEFSFSSSSRDSDDFAVHDDIASTFILPSVDHVQFSPAVSISAEAEATHWSDDWDAHDVTWGAASENASTVWESEGLGESEEFEYAGGVRTFLEDLEMVERERQFGPVMVGGLSG